MCFFQNTSIHFPPENSITKTVYLPETSFPSFQGRGCTKPMMQEARENRERGYFNPLLSKTDQLVIYHKIFLELPEKLKPQVVLLNWP